MLNVSTLGTQTVRTHISGADLEFYRDNGFLLFPGLFSRNEIDAMKMELPAIFAEDTPRRVLEKDSAIVRSVYGSHMTNKLFERLSQDARLVEPTMRFLDSQVYVHQFKINAKAGLSGDLWEWHQDYVFWLKEDGIPSDRLINAVVFLDEITEFNGPLFLLPGSHAEAVIDVEGRDEAPAAYKGSPSWITNLTVNLKYGLDRPAIERLVRRYGIVSPKGPSGSVLFFHPNTVHGSASNMSPFDRAVVIISYNSVNNIPSGVGKRRPEFLVGRDYRPILPLTSEIALC